MEKNKDIHFVYDQFITGIRQDEEGYICVQLGKGKRYVKLYHGLDNGKYVIYNEDKKGNWYVFLNKKDISKVLEFIKTIEIKEET